MKKKLLSVVLTLCTLFTMLQAVEIDTLAADDSGTCGTNVTWEYCESTNTLSISGSGAVTSYSGFDDYAAEVSTVKVGEGITSLCDYAFLNFKCVTSVSLPESLTKIGMYAFKNCEALESLNIPKGVTSLGRGFVNGCDSLKNIDVDGENKYFYSEGNCVIENSAYKLVAGCKASVIPDSVAEIGEYAFSDCIGITTLNIPSSVGIIGKSAFSFCDGLSAVSIPDTVNTVGENAFERCSGLVTASIGNGLYTVPKYMFYECDALKEISFGSAVAEIGEYAFYGCDSLEKITVDDNNNTFYDDSNCLITSETKKLTLGCKTSVIPFPVNEIGDYAFIAQSGIKSIYIPGFVTTIGENAFKNCDGLESVQMDNGITKIGYDAFSYCSSLKSLDIPGTASDVGLPFESCSSLESLTVGSGNTKYTSENNCIIDKTTNALLMGCQNSSIPTYVTSIGEGAFYGCTGLKNIEIPGKAEIIYNYAFCNCTSLTEVVIRNGVGGINYCAFSGCTAITDITVPSSVKYISDFAFYNCSSLKSMTLPFVGYNAKGENGTFFGYIFGATGYTLNNFYVPQTLKTVKITNATQIAANAFRGCAGITEIVIPDSVTSIGKGAFQDCSSLASLTIPFVGASKSVASNAFIGYIFGTTSYKNNATYVPATLKKLSITSATALGAYSLYYCKYLTEVNLPMALTTVGSAAFYNCSGLKSLFFYDSVTSIASKAFNACSSSLTLTCKKDSAVQSYAIANSIKYVTYDNVCEYIGHTPGADATCVEPQVCIVCGEILSDTIEHDYVEVEHVEATSDSDGYYVMQCVMCGEQHTYTIIKQSQDGSTGLTYNKGDIDHDGYVTENDLLILTRYLAGWKQYAADAATADINGDKKVTNMDRAILARYLAGWNGYTKYFS